jgi:hypothetical protein
MNRVLNEQRALAGLPLMESANITDTGTSNIEKLGTTTDGLVMVLRRRLYNKYTGAQVEDALGEFQVLFRDLGARITDEILPNDTTDEFPDAPAFPHESAGSRQSLVIPKGIPDKVQVNTWYCGKRADRAEYYLIANESLLPIDGKANKARSIWEAQRRVVYTARF